MSSEAALGQRGALVAVDDETMDWNSAICSGESSGPPRVHALRGHCGLSVRVVVELAEERNRRRRGCTIGISSGLMLLNPVRWMSMAFCAAVDVVSTESAVAEQAHPIVKT